MAKLSGKKTERIPWVNHLSGNIAAKCCIHDGKVVKIKKTPLKNWSTITTGETTAEAPLPDFGTTENAIPRRVEEAVPKIINQVKVSHLIGWVGSSSPKKIVPKKSKSTNCKNIE